MRTTTDKSLSFFDRKITIISSAILFTGISSGIFFVLIFPEADKQMLADCLQDFLATGKNSFLADITYNYILLFSIYLSGKSLYGFPFSILILLVNSFSYGVVSVLIYCCTSPGTAHQSFLGFIFLSIIMLF